MMEFPKLVDLVNHVEISVSQDKFLIGRGVQNSYVVEDILVSRTHCILEKINNDWTIIDKSANGTFVNSKLVQKNCPLVITHGDIINLTHNIKFMFSNTSPERIRQTEITDDEVTDLTEALLADIAADENTDGSDINKCCIDLTEQYNKAVSDVQPEASTVDDQVTDKIVAEAMEKNLKRMERELQCSICTELFIKAVTLNCAHTFCNFCISEWRRKQPVCPICRAKITSVSSTLVIDGFIATSLEKASEDVKLQRQEAIQLRETSNPKPSTKATSTATSTSRSRATGAIPRETIELSSDDEDSFEDLSEYSGSDWEEEYSRDTWYDGYNGTAGHYYGGYGQCYNCGDPGHWANGCPNRY